MRRVNEVDLRELAEGFEVLEEILVSERLDVGEVVVHVAGKGVVSVLVRKEAGLVGLVGRLDKGRGLT